MYRCMYVYKRIYVCKHDCQFVPVYVCVRGGTRMCRCARELLSVYLYLFVCSLACCSVSDSFSEIRTRCRRPKPDPDSCSLWTRYIDDSKTDSWDDLQISIGSCSEDQTAILFKNRVISCECLFLCHFLIYRYYWILCFYSYYFM